MSLARICVPEIRLIPTFVLCGLDEISSTGIAEGIDVEEQSSKTMFHTAR